MKFLRESRRALCVWGLSLAMVLVAGCGRSSGGGDEGSDLGALSLMFKHDVLALMPGVESVDCRIRVFPVEADRVGESENETTWHLDKTQQETELQITDIKPGLKEISAALIGADGQILGEGSIRYLVKPGAQRLTDPLTIKLSPDAQRRDVELAITVRPRLPADPTTYEDVQPILAQHCAGCHSAALPFGGLQLDAFPFQSVSMGTDQLDIVSSMITHMSSDVGPMPPTGRLDGAIVDVIQDWLDYGLQTAPARRFEDLVQGVELNWRKVGAPTWQAISATKESDGQFKATLAGATVGEDYELVATVFGLSGVILHQDPARTLQITASGAMPVDIAFDYVPPRVTVPIVIEQ